MANTNNAATWLKRLEEGTAEIYSRYQKMAEASRANYDAKLQSLNRQYADAANALSATSKIDLKNSLERMADAGYVKSGETVHATLAANTAKLGALSELEQKKADERSELERQALSEEAERSFEASREVSDLRRELEESAREQENRDREFEAEERQRAFENSLAQEKLAYQKASDERQTSTVSQETKDGGIVPSRSVQDYLGDIVNRYTFYSKEKGYKVKNRTSIANAIKTVVNDTNLSARYRYEFYLYAKSLGYIESK